VPADVSEGVPIAQLPDGRLTDMANLTWAKDVAVSIALGMLNRRAEIQRGRRMTTAISGFYSVYSGKVCISTKRKEKPTVLGRALPVKGNDDCPQSNQA
jgi:hypothetical protein